MSRPGAGEGSVTPFQLMMGKLLGSVGVSVLLAFIYIGGALAVASYWGYAGAASASQLAWFALFLLMAVVLFGSAPLWINAWITPACPIWLASNSGV